MDKLDKEIINKDINDHYEIKDLKKQLKQKNIHLTIGIVENIDNIGENINLLILDYNKDEENRSTIIPIPNNILESKFDNIIQYIKDYFT